MKEDWKPGTMIYPLPAVLVSCGKDESEYNIITVAYLSAGTVSKGSVRIMAAPGSTGRTAFFTK